MWPTPQDYNEAVQTPHLAFSDPDLQHATVLLNQLGLPKPVSGSFASVYQLHTKVGQKWAVRCFLRNVPDQEARYRLISEHLQRCPLEWLVPFEFVHKGIRVSGEWFPILKMQWVSGVPLTEWIERHIDDAGALRSLQNSFTEMYRALQERDIGHGDLQHGNILIIDGKPRLVDYDGLFVPALAAMGSVELGHRHYQHPRRSAAHFGTYLDNFSAWSIWTSLHCLTQDARLWRKLGSGDECLLFQHEDYVTPSESVAFSCLEQHDSEVVRDASLTMRRLLTLEPENVPPLGEPIQGANEVETMPPLVVAGYSPGPESVVANLRAAVAMAKAPTLVIVQPQIRLVESPGTPPNQATAQPIKIAPWYLQSPAPPAPPTSPAPPPAQPQRNSTRWDVLILLAITGLIWIGIPQLNSYLIQSKKHSSTNIPTKLSVIDDLSKPLSAKLRPDDAAVSTYQQAYEQFEEKDYKEAYRLFALALNERFDIRFDYALCNYMMAKCLMEQGGDNYQILGLLNLVQEQCSAQSFWIPKLSYELAVAEMKCGNPLKAAATLVNDLKYDSTELRAYKISLLRKAALAAMDLRETKSLEYYDQFVDMVAGAPLPNKAESIYADLNAKIAQLEKQQYYTFAQQIAVCAQTCLQRPQFANDTQNDENIKSLQNTILRLQTKVYTGGSR